MCQCDVPSLPPPLPDTAGKYSYKIFPSGDTTANAVLSAGPVNIVPWTTTTTTFTTDTISPNGLYRVWVKVQHADSSSTYEADSDVNSPFAVGEQDGWWQASFSPTMAEQQG